MLKIDEIKEVLPHEYPFLLVDRIVEIEPGEKVVGLKNVTINEEFFNGHFPGHPIMPGVLILEAMAQVAGVGLLDSVGGDDKVPYFAGANNVRFRKPVKPGDQLIIEANIIKLRRSIGKIKAEARVDDNLVAEAEITCAVQDK